MKHLALVIAIALGNCVCTESDQPLQLTQTIALPGVEGRIDRLAFDAAGERLFVCALGNNSVEVIDLRKAERIYSIIGLGVPQGIAYIPQLDRLFIANDKGGIFKIYDARSLQQIGELNFKDDADNLRYDNATKKVYAGFGSGGLAVVSAPDGKQIGSIKLSAHPEAFELEKQGKRIFVNVPNAGRWRLLIATKAKSSQHGKQAGRLEIFLWHLMKRITGCLSGVACRRSSSCSTPIQVRWLQRSTSSQRDANTYKISANIDTAVGARTGLLEPERDSRGGGTFLPQKRDGKITRAIRGYRFTVR